jgi:hypothetical protein
LRDGLANGFASVSNVSGEVVLVKSLSAALYTSADFPSFIEEPENPGLLSPGMNGLPFEIQ